MQWLILAVCLLSFGVALYALHKIRHVHLQTFRIIAGLKEESSQLYNQLQAFHDLTALLNLPRPLPLLRGWAGSPDFLLHIAQHALNEKPGIIMECGAGASTIVLARCCQMSGKGRVHSLEHDPHYAALTRVRLSEQGLETWATVVDAPMEEKQGFGQAWYALGNLKLDPVSCEMLVIDGPPWRTAPLARYPTLALLQNWLAPSCVVFLDDAARPEEQEILQRWRREFPSFGQEVLAYEKGCARLFRNSLT